MKETKALMLLGKVALFLCEGQDMNDLMLLLQNTITDNSGIFLLNSK